MALFGVQGVEQQLVSKDGKRLLIIGTADANLDDLKSACELTLRGTNMSPRYESAEKARAAWRERDDRTKWVPGG